MNVRVSARRAAQSKPASAVVYFAFACFRFSLCQRARKCSRSLAQRRRGECNYLYCRESFCDEKKLLSPKSSNAVCVARRLLNSLLRSEHLSDFYIRAADLDDGYAERAG